MSNTVTLPRWAVVAVAAAIAASTAGNVSTVVREPDLHIIELCGLPGADCLDLASQPVMPDVGEIILCCDYLSGDCSIAEALSDCHPEHEYAVICEHGRTLVSGGIECFD
jgi:hypothetical protein